jgi:hypothetical protein
MKTNSALQMHSSPVTIIFTLLLVLCSISGRSQDFTRKYDGNYTVVKGAELVIENKFGKINCIVWDESRVTINVTVTVDASSQEKANKVLEKISVALSGSQTRVEGKTSVGNINNGDFSIDYDIHMPRWININLNNQFGDIYLDDIDGTAKINLEYGAMEANSFTGGKTDLTIKFSDAEVDFIKDGNLNIEYSEWEMGNSENFRLYSRFNEVSLGEVTNLVVDSQYDDISVKSAGEVVLVNRFTDMELDKIKGKFDFDIEYGELEVEYISSAFSTGKIRNSFAGVQLTFDPKTSLNIDANMEFGELSYPKATSMNHQTVDYTTNIYKGKLGTGTVSGQVTITSKNADVSINFSE